MKLRNQDADSALYLAEAALRQSIEVLDSGLMERAHNHLGILHRYRGDFDAAIHEYKASLEICIAHGDSLCMIRAWHNLGVVARKQGALSKALEFELRGISFLQQANEPRELGHAYNSLGIIYSMQANWTKAIEYYELGLSLQREIGNKQGESRSLYNLGVTYYNQGDIQAAEKVILERLELSKVLNDKRSMAKSFHSLGIMAQDKRDFRKAQEYLEQATSLQREMEDIEGQLYSLEELGRLYQNQKMMDKAVNAYDQMLSLALSIGSREDELAARNRLSNILEQQGRHAEALTQLQQASMLKDTLRNESTGQRLLELQEKYETEKKEKENRLLQQENELAANEIEAKSQSLLLRNVILGVMIIILALGGLLLFNVRQRLQTTRMLNAEREARNRQKMLDMVREQEIAYMNATLIGQESERNRIAADLHDGLSNMLVTVKLHFENLSDHLTAEQPEVRERYQNAVNLLDELCKKARSLSHEMVDEQSKFRLQPALEELVGIIEQTGQLRVELSVHGLENSLGAATENAIFHILRELVGNCLKHAEASVLTIQLTRFHDALNIMVEDNGVGFDPATVKQNGMGLGNVADRIYKMNGSVSIDAASGRGTVVNIDVPLVANEVNKTTE